MKTIIVTLEISYNEDCYNHSDSWDWNDLLEMNSSATGLGDVSVVKIEEKA